MPTNHRGQDIGAHNHANVVNMVRQTVDEWGETHNSYEDLNGEEAYTTSVEPPSSVSPGYIAGATAYPVGKKTEYTQGVYSNKKRADMAAQAMVNRHVRTGSFSPSQRGIKANRSIRKYGEESLY